MYGILTIATFLFAGGAALLAAFSAREWFRASNVPVPDLPDDVSTPVVGPDRSPVPISMIEEAARREALAGTLRATLVSARRSADLNGRGARLAGWAALLTTISLALPIIRDFGVFLSLWVGQ